MVPQDVKEKLISAAARHGLDIQGGTVRRTSSRCCLSVEHGDYNGTDLFGVGTDRYIWMAFKPNDTKRVRLISVNFEDEDVVDFDIGQIPDASTVAGRWARFPAGVASILRRDGFEIRNGLDAVLYGNIPGGGMSRSASLSINLTLGFLDANGIVIPPGMRVVEIAQAVENDYIGSPCGNLDQIMIYFARAGMGTLYQPAEGRITHVPLGPKCASFNIVSLDTGTQRPGLEYSTYKIRRRECEHLVELANERGVQINCLADVRNPSLYNQILTTFVDEYPHLCRRLKYVYEAQQRFSRLLDAWKAGDVFTIGRVFRADGFGLRDDYEISGPELEAMCQIVRRVDGVLGERMLGGGDRGAAGAIVLRTALDEVRLAVAAAYPQMFPELREKFSVHACSLCDGVSTAVL